MHINRTAVRDIALEISKTERSGKFTRVSETFFLRANQALKNWIRAEIRRHPSIGTTLK